MTSKSQKQAEANIQTFLRIRPSKIPSGFFAPDDLEKDSLNVALPDNYKSDYINNSKLRYSFHFNGIINMDATQDEVFSRVGAAAVRNALDGFNSTIFAYGQTGSGKVSFTLLLSKRQWISILLSSYLDFHAHWRARKVF